MAAKYSCFQKRLEDVRLATNVAENAEEDHSGAGAGSIDPGIEFGGDDNQDNLGAEGGGGVVDNGNGGEEDGGNGDVASTSGSKKTKSGGKSRKTSGRGGSSRPVSKARTKKPRKSSNPTLLQMGAAGSTDGGVAESCM